jgi:O-antigen/teichoic acid export membrane protein
MRTSLPTVLVGMVTGSRQVSYFRAAQAPSTAFASLSAPARLVLLAEQTRDIEHGRTERAYGLLRRYIISTAALGLVITPVLWWAMPTLIRWVYKPKYVPAADAFRVMLLAAVVQLVFAWTKSFPVSIGRMGMRTVGQLFEIAVLVPAVLILANLYGATGAAGGVLAGAIALGAFWSVALLRIRSAA